MNKLDLYTVDAGKRSYLLSLLIAIDQLVNCLLCGFPDETVSSRAHRCNDKRKWQIAEKVINTLFWFDEDNGMKHCELSYYGELSREHFPITVKTHTNT